MLLEELDEFGGGGQVPSVKRDSKGVHSLGTRARLKRFEVRLSCLNSFLNTSKSLQYRRRLTNYSPPLSSSE